MTHKRIIIIPAPSPLLPSLLPHLLSSSAVHVVSPPNSPPPHPPHPHLHLHPSFAALLSIINGADTFPLVLLLLPPAAPSTLGSVLSAPPKAFETQLEQSFHQPWAAVQAVLPLMRRARYGHIVSVSGLTAEMGYPGLGARCAGDGMLAGVLEGLAYEVAPFGVRITLLMCNLGVVSIASESEGGVEKGVIKEEREGEEGPGEKTGINEWMERLRKFCGAGEEETVRELGEVVARIAGELNPPVRVWVGEEVVEGVRERLRVLSEEMEGVLGGGLGEE